ncbi:MAG: nitroreductase family protein [Firmicutes bacterium]|nr:nitroreductase family protein [Bacillota bacterium]
MEFKDIVYNNRSYRRFYESESINMSTLKYLADLARVSPCGANLQKLRYRLSNTPEENQKIFSCLGWAGYYKDWDGPEEGERPTGYIVILSDKDIKGGSALDAGIAAQTIMLAATDKGYRGCMIGNINRQKLFPLLGISEDKYNIELVLALGIPKEEVRICEYTDSVKYFRDESDVHNVPKKKLEDILV